MFSERLKKFLETEQIQAIEFAERMKIQRSGVSHLISGRNNPNMDFLVAFAHNYPSINLRWLITGEGEMKQLKEIQSETEITKPVQRQIEHIEKTSDHPIKEKYATKDRRLVSVLYVYDDNTFKELKPDI